MFLNIYLYKKIITNYYNEDEYDKIYTWILILNHITKGVRWLTFSPNLEGNIKSIILIINYKMMRKCV